MIIKDKKVIKEGVKLFNSINAFKFACSDYFRFKNRGVDDDAIQDLLGFLGLSRPQRMFLSALWEDPKYSDSYRKDPCVIIVTNDGQWLFDNGLIIL